MFLYIHIDRYVYKHIYVCIYRYLLEALDEAADVRDPLERDPKVPLHLCIYTCIHKQISWIRICI